MSDDISSMFPGWKSVKSTLEYIKQYNLNKDTARKMEEWEKEKLPEAETIKLFQELVESGVVWRLPIFGGQAYGLIKAGLVHYPDKLVTEMQKYDDEGNPLPTQKEYLEGRKREEEEFWRLQQSKEVQTPENTQKAMKGKHFPSLNMSKDWEEGTLSDADTIKLFQELVDSGQAWRLQGRYGRTAADLIDAGLVHYPEKLVTAEQKHNYWGQTLPTQKEYLEGRKREEEEFWKLQQHQKLAAQAPKVKQQMIIHPPRLSIPLLERVPSIVVIPSQNNTLPAKENITMKELEHAEDAIKKLSRVRKLERVKA